MALTVDTRTATEYGVVRTFGQGDFQFTTQGNNTTNPTSFTGIADVGHLHRPAEPRPAKATSRLSTVFLQFAGFTFGKSSSAYATPWNGYPGNNTSFLLGGPDYVTGVNNIQYTAQFGNGVSATIGLDDPTVFNRTVVSNLASAIGLNSFALTPATLTLARMLPTSSANIRVDQAWGMFQISGVAHEVSLLQLPEHRCRSGWRCCRQGSSDRFVGNLRPPRRPSGAVL